MSKNLDAFYLEMSTKRFLTIAEIKGYLRNPKQYVWIISFVDPTCTQISLTLFEHKAICEQIFSKDSNLRFFMEKSISGLLDYETAVFMIASSRAKEQLSDKYVGILTKYLLGQSPPGLTSPMTYKSFIDVLGTTYPGWINASAPGLKATLFEFGEPSCPDGIYTCTTLDVCLPSNEVLFTVYFVNGKVYGNLNWALKCYKKSYDTEDFSLLWRTEDYVMREQCKGFYDMINVIITSFASHLNNVDPTGVRWTKYAPKPNPVVLDDKDWIMNWIMKNPSKYPLVLNEKISLKELLQKSLLK